MTAGIEADRGLGRLTRESVEALLARLRAATLDGLDAVEAADWTRLERLLEEREKLLARLRPHLEVVRAGAGINAEVAAVDRAQAIRRLDVVEAFNAKLQAALESRLAETRTELRKVAAEQTEPAPYGKREAAVGKHLDFRK